MTFNDLVLDTLRTLWAHKLRTFLTMFGIAWGIISITLMVAAGEGLREGQEKQEETFAKDLIIFFGGRTSLQAGGLRAGRETNWTAEDITPVTQDATACRYVLPEQERDNVNVRSLYNSATPQVSGSYPPFQEIRSIRVQSGRFYDWGDEQQRHRVAFLGSNINKQLFAGRDSLGATILLDDIPYTVIGVMVSKDQNSSYDGWDVDKIFVPFSAMLEDFPSKPPLLPTDVNHFLVAPRSLADHERCRSQVKRTLARIHRFDPNDKEALPVWDTVQDGQAFAKLMDAMQYFLGAIGTTTLLLGGIGVMNVMLVAVRERTREIGVRKAVGASSGAILQQFFVETLIIVFLSGGAGMAVAYGLCALVNLAPMPPFFAGMKPTWQSGTLSFIVLGTVAVLSALYPATRAARVDPIDALRFEAGG
jgi:putative ABC transport system permease protein